MIFISHSTKDKEAALDLQERLRAAGYSCEQHFLDSDQRSGIRLGEKWEKVIFDNLRDCRVMIILCSPNWLQSKWCFAELASAKMGGKEVFPVVLEECDRSALGEYQAVFINQENKDDREKSFNRLLLDLETRGFGPNDFLPWPNPELKDVSGNVDDCPFPGLPAFDERYAAVYFGREREKTVVLEELRKMRSNGEPRFLIIVGGSGSGKSSLLMAGVLPRLKHKTAHTEWAVLPTLRFIGRDDDNALFETLAKGVIALYRKNAQVERKPAPDWKKLRDQFANEDASQAARAFLEASTDSTLSSGNPDAAMVLPIDQFEEFVVPTPRAMKFLRFLEQVCRFQNDRMLIIGTMRSDFLDQYERHPNAIKSPKFASWRLEPFPREQIESVIVKPAERAHTDVAKELLQKLNEDTPSTDALPLLAFTLEKLYRDFGRDKKLELAEYQKLGGMDGSIRSTADSIVSSISKQAQDAVRVAFVKHLAQVNEKGDFIRLTAKWSDLDPAAQPILEEFISKRLITRNSRDGLDLIEVSHEAIFRCWKPLASWLTTSADIARWRRDITRDQTSAAANHRRWPGLTSAQLAVARHWPRTRTLELSSDEKGWINKAIRKSRTLKFFFMCTALIVVSLAFMSYISRETSLREQSERIVAEQTAEVERRYRERLTKIANSGGRVYLEPSGSSTRTETAYSVVFDNSFRANSKIGQERIEAAPRVDATPPTTNLDDTLSGIVDLGQLQSITMVHPPYLVSDRGLEFLSKCQSLERLEITREKNFLVTFEYSIPITDLALVEVARLKNLRVLVLSNSKISDEGMSEIGKLDSLVSLGLDGTAISDLGLSKINALSNLEELSIVGTRVSDEGLLHLEKLSKLSSVQCWDTRVTEIGERRLEKTLPYCSVRQTKLENLRNVMRFTPRRSEAEPAPPAEAELAPAPPAEALYLNPTDNIE